MSLVHELLEELIDLFEPLGLSGQLLFDVRSCEDVFEINPLFLANDPLFNHLVEGEQVFFPNFGFTAQRFHIARTQDHIDGGHSFV